MARIKVVSAEKAPKALKARRQGADPTRRFAEVHQRLETLGTDQALQVSPDKGEDVEKLAHRLRTWAYYLHPEFQVVADSQSVYLLRRGASKPGPTSKTGIKK